MLKRLSPRRFLPPLPKWMKKGGITENLEMQSLTNLEKLFAAAAGPGRDAVPILRPMVQALHKDAIGYDPSKPVDAFHALERATDRQLDAFRSDLQQYIEDGMRETTTLPSGENSSAANVDGEEHSIQEYDSLLPRAVAGFRLLLLKHYCKGMNEALCGDDLSISFPKHEVPFRPLIDAALMGTMSERLTAHMELFKEDLNQEKLQAMYYLALEPEVVAVTQLLNDQPGSPRKVVKALNKYARTYLLDVVAEYKIAPVSLTGLIPSTRISSLSWTKRPWTYSHSRRGPENSFQRVRM